MQFSLDPVSYFSPLIFRPYLEGRVNNEILTLTTHLQPYNKLRFKSGEKRWDRHERSL